MDIENGASGEWFWTRPMQGLLGQFAAAAALNSPILVVGERGAGKTHGARVLHSLSRRKERPFVVVDCHTLAGLWFESQLFGHVRGAFIGADADQIGKLTEVADGTLLLDEIDRVPLEDQEKLLRVLRRHEYEPLGSHRPSPLAARVIATSSRPLSREVAAGRFSSELYDLVSELTIQLPVLRRTPESIRPLAQRFLSDFCTRQGRPPCALTREAWSDLEAYDWPGNVGELQHVIEQAVLRCRNGMITAADLTESQSGRVSQPSAAWAPPAPLLIDAIGGLAEAG